MNWTVPDRKAWERVPQALMLASSAVFSENTFRIFQAATHTHTHATPRYPTLPHASPRAEMCSAAQQSINMKKKRKLTLVPVCAPRVRRRVDARLSKHKGGDFVFSLLSPILCQSPPAMPSAPSCAWYWHVTQTRPATRCLALTLSCYEREQAPTQRPGIMTSLSVLSVLLTIIPCSWVCF